MENTFRLVDVGVPWSKNVNKFSLTASELTLKESKIWSHGEIGPLDVSMGIKDAEDESCRVRSRGVK